MHGHERNRAVEESPRPKEVRRPHVQGPPEATLAGRLDAGRPDGLLRLQHIAGNRATASLLADIDRSPAGRVHLAEGVAGRAATRSTSAPGMRPAPHRRGGTRGQEPGDVRCQRDVSHPQPGVGFKLDESVVSKKVLEAWYARLAAEDSRILADPLAHVLIVATASRAGNAEYNLQLSRARAMAVRDWLVQKEVQARISVLPLGELPARFSGTVDGRDAPADRVAYIRLVPASVSTDMPEEPAHRGPVEPRAPEPAKRPTRYWSVRSVGQASVGARGLVVVGALIQVKNRVTGQVGTFDFEGVGLGAGILGFVSASPGWSNFVTTRPHELTDFEGAARMTGMAVGLGFHLEWRVIDFYGVDVEYDFTDRLWYGDAVPIGGWGAGTGVSIDTVPYGRLGYLGSSQEEPDPPLGVLLDDMQKEVRQIMKGGRKQVSTEWPLACFPE